MFACKLLRVQIVKPMNGISGIQTYISMLEENMRPINVAVETVVTLEVFLQFSTC
jgi:hypothetical protein